MHSARQCWRLVCFFSLQVLPIFFVQAEESVLNEVVVLVQEGVGSDLDSPVELCLPNLQQEISTDNNGEKAVKQCENEDEKFSAGRESRTISADVPVLRQRSLPVDEPIFSERIEAIQDAAQNPFSIASHQTNYLLPVAYNNSPNQPWASEDPVQLADRDAFELQFQLSMQIPLWSGFLGDKSFASLAYTNRSFWRAYNSSAPFRETNHEPELIMTWLNDWRFLGFQNTTSQIAISHQSNGRSGNFSRGWNRIYFNLMFEKDNYFFSFKPWYRIEEEVEGDDNPDLEFYLGNFELTGGYQSNNFGVSMTLRNNLREENRGAIDLCWTFPIGSRIRGFVKYFNGYGESLIDYNEKVQTFGLGVELARGI